ncbi:MAG: ribonuclease III [Alphaproteobacteria bacterium]|nr:ribonuclease III [Alphaproteobacteria bacterium]
MQKSLRDLFNNPNLFDQAIQLASGSKAAAYERLEFLGDRVLGLVVAEMLYQTYSKEKEGALAKRFVALTREETLADVAHLWRLNKLVKTTDSELKENNSVLSDVCEAVLGALYLDQGLEAVKHLMLPVWMPLMESNAQAPQDPKSACQEWAQHNFKCLPIYKTIEQMGTEHEPVFKVQVKVGKLTAFGVGHNKKEAEKEAARNLLEQHHG